MTEITSKKGFVSYRILLLFALIIACLILVRFSPLGTYLDFASLKNMIEQSGTWGYFLFFVLFVLAAIMNVPGTLFLIIGILLFGYFWGPVLSYIAAFAGAIVTFYIGRVIGGKSLTDIKSPFVRNLLNEAETKPYRTLLILRVLIQFSPVIGYTLSLTNMKTKHYISANLLALIIPTLIISFIMFVSEDIVYKFLM